MFLNVLKRIKKSYSTLLVAFDISNDEIILFYTPLVSRVGTKYCMKGAEGGGLN